MPLNEGCLEFAAKVSTGDSPLIIGLSDQRRFGASLHALHTRYASEMDHYCHLSHEMVICLVIGCHSLNSLCIRKMNLLSFMVGSDTLQSNVYIRPCPVQHPRN